MIIVGDILPVDIELMFEQLKWIDPKVYRMFCRLKYKGMSGDQLKNEGRTFSNLMQAINFAYQLDVLEHSGDVEIYNDYENERVWARRLTRYEPDGGEE